jgi:hypothetical protein
MLDAVVGHGVVIGLLGEFERAFHQGFVLIQKEPNAPCCRL